MAGRRLPGNTTTGSARKTASVIVRVRPRSARSPRVRSAPSRSSSCWADGRPLTVSRVLLTRSLGELHADDLVAPLAAAAAAGRVDHPFRVDGLLERAVQLHGRHLAPRDRGVL